MHYFVSRKTKFKWIFKYKWVSIFDLDINFYFASLLVLQLNAFFTSIFANMNQLVSSICSTNNWGLRANSFCDLMSDILFTKVLNNIKIMNGKNSYERKVKIEIDREGKRGLWSIDMRTLKKDDPYVSINCVKGNHYTLNIPI